MRVARRLVLAALCLGAFAGPVSAAHASVLPPQLDESAASPSITLNSTTNLIFQVSNFNDTTALSNIGFSETVPVGLQVVQANTFDCSGTGTVNADPMSGVISLTGANLVAGGMCAFTVKVKGVAQGAQVATSGPISATESGAGGTGSTTVNVVGPASLATSFGAPSIAVGGATTISYTVTNANGVDLTGVAFTDSLPSGLVVSTPNNLNSTCDPGATLTAAAGSSSVSFSGATVTASSSCTITASVTATSGGSLTNTTSAITSTNPSQTGSTASASLLVVQAPALTTSFGAGTIKVGTSTTASFSVHNPNASTTLTGLAFSDTLPAGLTVATPNGLSGACGGGTITATAGSSSISLSGASLAGNATCNFSVNVVGAVAGALTNTTGAITSTQSGAAGTASASLNVVGPPTISLSYADSAVSLNSTTTMTLTITNPASNPITLHGVGVTDTLPSGLKVATPNNLGGTCPGGTVTATAGSSSVTVSGAALAPNATCTVLVDVLASSVGTLNNTTGNVTSTEGGNGSTASASLVVALAPALHISFSPTSITVGQTSTITYNATNTNNVALNGIGFTDTLPAGLTIAPSGLSGTCGGGTITAADGTGEVDLSGATLAASGSCTFTVTVTPSAYGTLTNTTSQITSSNGGNGPAASASLQVQALAPTIALAFGAPTIAVNSTTTMTLTITNPSGNPATIHGVGVSDTLPSGLKVATPNNLGGSCPSATVTAVAGSSSVSVSGGVLAHNATCTVNVDVVGTTVGTQNDTTGNVTSTESGNGSTASASVVVAVAPTLAMSFSPTSVTVGQSSTITYHLSNTNNVALNGIGFTDTLPAGLTIATGGLTGTCGGGTITAADGTGEVDLSGATLAAGGSCNFTVAVTTSAYGTLANTTSQISSSNGGNGAPASASVQVQALAPTIAASFNDPSIAVNSTTTLNITITNAAGNPATIHGVGVSDTLPAGLKVATPNNLGGSCPGGTVTAVAGSSSVSVSGAVLVPSGTCTVQVDVLGTTVGTKTNTTGNVTSTESGNGSTATASVVVAVAPTLQIAFAPASISSGQTSTLSFNLANTNGVALNGVGFTDTLPAGMTIATGGLTGTCGGGTITAVDGTNQIDLSGATLAANGSCSFTVKVTSSTLGTSTDTTSAVGSSNGGNGAAASASLLVLQAPTMTLKFTAGTIAAGQPTAATFTIQNPNPGTALSGVAVSDPLPSGLIVATPNGAANACGGSLSAAAGSGTIALTAGTVAANGSCSFKVNVTGTTAGTKNDTTGAVSSTQTGAGGTGSDSVTVVVAPTIAESFGAASVSSGATTSLNFTLTNPAANPISLSGIGFDDPLPAGLVVATPSNLVGGCGGGTIVANSGSADVNLSGASIPVGGSCTFSVDVKAVGGGPQTNVTGHVTSTEGGTGGTASATLDVPLAPNISIAFGDQSIVLSTLTSLSFTLTNPNPVALTGVGFTDSLPSGLVLVTLKALTTACSGGTITTAASSLTLAGGKLPANASCSFSVFVTGAAVGVKDNTTGPVTSTEGGAGGTASARLTVTTTRSPTTATTSTPAAPPPPPGGTTKGGNSGGKVSCVVPRLTGKTLKQGRKMLSKAHCKLGKVSRKTVATARPGRIAKQSIKARSKRKAGTKVAVTLAR